jgi:hypothetical protein
MKTILLTVGAFALISLSSCKKDWTCQCTDNNGNNDYHDIPNATIGDARETCGDFEYNNALGYNNCSLVE